MCVLFIGLSGISGKTIFFRFFFDCCLFVNIVIMGVCVEVMLKFLLLYFIVCKIYFMLMF